MEQPDTTLRALHKRFCELTGKTYLFEQWQHDWWEFNRFYTEADLEIVIAYAERVNLKREKKYQIVTTLKKIIGDLREFDSLKAEAELEAKKLAAKKRQWVASPADKVLSNFRGTEPVEPDKPAERVSMDIVINSMRKAAKG